MNIGVRAVKLTPSLSNPLLSGGVLARRGDLRPPFSNFSTTSIGAHSCTIAGLQLGQFANAGRLWHPGARLPIVGSLSCGSGNLKRRSPRAPFTNGSYIPRNSPI